MQCGAYETAEQAVIAKMQEEFYEQAPPRHGEHIKLDGLEDLDCIPVKFHVAGQPGMWRLAGVAESGKRGRWGGGLSATYMFETPGVQWTNGHQDQSPRP